jgi:hypothetical protein
MTRERLEKIKKNFDGIECGCQVYARELIAEVERLQAIESRMTHTAEKAARRARTRGNGRGQRA